eukprot:gene11123-3183_t
MTSKAACRDGKRAKVVLPNGDTYLGEWKDDLMHGKGLYTSNRNHYLYEGDFKSGKRDGYGVKRTDLTTKHTLDRGKTTVFTSGHGVKFYDKNGTSVYDGEWQHGKRSGWGRMTYADGSIYEGEWENDDRNGRGLLLLPNQDRYEGEWENDLKHGDGTFYYMSKGQCYKGVWKDGTPKCGELIDIERDVAVDSTKYPIPELTLKEPNGVLREAREFLMS